MKRYPVELSILALTLLLGLIGCLWLHHYTAAGLVSEEEPLLFGATYMTMNNPFYEVIDEELRNQVEAGGDVMITMDPQLSIERQIEQIKTMMAEGIDVLREASQKGIIVIAIDTNVYDGEDFVDHTVVSDNYQAGQLCARYMMEHRESADIVLLSHGAAYSAQERLQGFRDAIADEPGYHIVSELDCEGQLEKSMPLIEGLLEQGTAFDVVMALNDPSALGAVAALQDQKIDEDAVMVLGVDGAPEAKVLIKEGYMDATVAQYPKKMAQKAISAAYAIKAGDHELQEEEIAVSLIDGSNVDEYLLEGWQ